MTMSRLGCEMEVHERKVGMEICEKSAEMVHDLAGVELQALGPYGREDE
jgi:hypothetical protein